MQKVASMASTLVLYFLPNCANFWAVGGELLFCDVDMHSLCICANFGAFFTLFETLLTLMAMVTLLAILASFCQYCMNIV